MKCKDCRFFKKLRIQNTETFCCCKNFMDPDGVIIQMNKPLNCGEDSEPTNDSIVDYYDIILSYLFFLTQGVALYGLPFI